MSAKNGLVQSTYSNLMNFEYPKSNVLITSKYKLSLFENKLFAYALSKVACTDGNIYSVLYNDEIKQFFKTNGHFYENLRNAALNLEGKTLAYSNPKKKIFDYITIITRVTYADGVLMIKFNPDIKEYILELHKNFTKLSLPIMLSFESVYAFRLYEMLKSYCYGINENGTYHIRYSLSELKFELGIIDISNEKVKKNLSRQKGTPDYDKVIEDSGVKTYSDWQNIKHRVIDPTIKEIVKKTDINITYHTIRGGIGGKTQAIMFDVSLKEPVVDNSNVIDITDKELKEISVDDETVKSLVELFGGAITENNAINIIKAAEGSLERVKKAYECFGKQKGKVDNITGWMISAIRNNYQVTSQKMKYYNRFNDFEQYDYNWAEIEKELISN